MKVSVMLCAALGGFLFGYDTSVINASVFQMKDHFGFGEHSWQYSLIVAIAIAGAFFGAFASGFVSARFGRRPCIMVADILFIVGSVLMACAPNVAVVLVGRVIVGLGIGFSSATIPVYLAEVTSPKHRGATIVLNNVFLTGGQFIAAGFSALMVVYTSENVGWRVAIGAGGAPALIQLVCVIFFLPESPRWLACKGTFEEAKLVADKYEVDLGEYDENELRTVDMDYRSLIKRDMRFRLFLSCALQIIQQFSGTNLVQYYSSVILYDAGFQDLYMPVILSVPLAAMNALFTVVAIFTVDKLGRRFLLLVSCGGCLAVMLIISIIGYLLDKQIPYSVGGWVFLALLAVFFVFYAPGLGCIPWVVMGEIFPTHLRTSAASVVTMSNWAANAVVSQVFPLLLGAIGVGGAFTIFVGLLLASFIFLWFFAVETKGLSLEQIDNLFRKRAGLAPVFHHADGDDGFNDVAGSMYGDIDLLNEIPNQRLHARNNDSGNELATVPTDGQRYLATDNNDAKKKQSKNSNTSESSPASPSDKAKPDTHFAVDSGVEVEDSEDTSNKAATAASAKRQETGGSSSPEDEVRK